MPQNTSVDLGTYLIAAIICVALTLVPGFIAKKKGRSFFGYFILSWIISPLIVIIITLCLSDVSYAGFQKSMQTQYASWVCSCGRQHPSTVKVCPCGVEKPEVRVESSDPNGWTCSCGRHHAKYESSCVCGKTKQDAMNP